ncbi:unnamed protein product [Clavelina lepadiformis]|uniref:Uncharacterized protein n=1 Tax=Clavelina lepadiformis TaxID=159417 RepID=A0ABP0FZG7_CLALP
MPCLRFTMLAFHKNNHCTFSMAVSTGYESGTIRPVLEVLRMFYDTIIPYNSSNPRSIKSASYEFIGPGQKGRAKSYLFHRLICTNAFHVALVEKMAGIGWSWLGPNEYVYNSTTKICKTTWTFKTYVYKLKKNNA